MLNVKTKIAILSSYLAGVYTTVTAIAREFSVSRKLVYHLYRKVEVGLAGERPGPKGGEVERLQRENERLQQDVAALEGRVAELEAALVDSIKVTPARVERLRRAAVVAPLSYDEAERIVAVAYGEGWARSGGWERGFVAEQGAAAGLVLEELKIAERMRRGAADEVFLGGAPVLTVVEPRSLAVLGVRKEDRKADTWVAFLKPFKNLEIVASDQGTGVVGGIKRSGRQHQGDWEHLSWKVAAVERAIWQQGAAALARQEQAHAAYTARKIRRKSYEKIQQAVDQEFAQAEQYLQACAEIHRAFELVDTGSDHLQRSAESQARVEQALAVLDGLAVPAVARLRTYLAGRLPAFFLFLEELQKDLARVPVELKPAARGLLVTYARDVIAREVALRQRLEQRGSWPIQEAYLHTLEELRGVSAQIKNYKHVQAQVEEIVAGVLRASSIAEYFNGRLRIHQYVKKHLSQEYLNLLLLRYLTTPFEEGPRKGKSPLELLEIDTGGADWHQMIEAMLQQVA
jgi:hypothetical protein